MTQQYKNKKEIYGSVKRILFPKGNSENDFYIFKLEEFSLGKEIVVKGNFPNFKPYTGLIFKMEGEFEFNSKFQNWQFNVKSFDEKGLETEQGLEIYLTKVSPSMDSITAKRLVDTYGMNLPSILDETPEIILNSTLLREDQKEDLLKHWKSNKIQRDFFILLQKYNVPTFVIKKIYSIFKEGSQKVILNNPYLLVDIAGLPFENGDSIARKLNFSDNCEERIRSCLLYILKNLCFSEGHLFITLDQLIQGIKDFFKRTKIKSFYITRSLLDLQLKLLEAENKVVVEHKKETTFIYSNFHYKVEAQSAEKLRKLVNTKSQFTKKFLTGWIKDYQENNGITFTKEQEKALHLLQKNRLLIISGNPGTGKSFLAKALTQLFTDKNLKTILLAPTGIAAKKLNSLTGLQSGTIHRTLKWDGSDVEFKKQQNEYDLVWGFNSIHPYPADTFIIDETSMVDQFVFFHLLDAIPEKSYIIFIGDSDQLPSVGAGNVLNELVKSDSIPVIKLTQILRQAETSDIILHAHKINKGEIPTLEEMTNKHDLTFIPTKTDLDVSDGIKKIVTNLAQRNKEIQVISPLYRSIIGVSQLNKSLRNILNPPSSNKDEAILGDIVFRKGDKIVVTRNNYDKVIFNGEDGEIVEIDTQDSSILIKLTGVKELISLKYAEAETHLAHSYCLTIHKVQGNEYDYVIMPLTKTFNVMLQRKLIYTAITRARKKVIILGSYASFIEAIQNDETNTRNTLLAKRLRSEI